MVLENKFKIGDAAELARVEESTGKRNALKLFTSGRLENFPPGKFSTLAEIHRALFGEIYDFAGKIRTVNLAKGHFRFAAALTDKIDDREIFMKGVDASYFYENYFAYRTREL